MKYEWTAEKSEALQLDHFQLAGLVDGLLVAFDKDPDCVFKAKDLAGAIRHTIEKVEKGEIK